MKKSLIICMLCIMLFTGCSKSKIPFPTKYTYSATTDQYEFIITPDSLTIKPKEFITSSIYISYESRTINFSGIVSDLDTKTERLLFLGELINYIFTYKTPFVTNKTSNTLVISGEYMQDEYSLILDLQTLNPLVLEWNKMKIEFN